MIGRRLGLIHRGQLGLTLVELLIAFALVGIVTAGVTMTISHVFTRSVHTRDHMTVVRQVQSAGYWVSRDALQAQDVDTFEFLELTWTEIETGDKYEVVYSLIDMPSGGLKSLQRSVTVTPPGEGATPTTTVSLVAQHIDPAGTGFEPVAGALPRGGTLVFTVTARVVDQSEKRVYEITPRPGS